MFNMYETIKFSDTINTIGLDIHYSNFKNLDDRVIVIRSFIQTPEKIYIPKSYLHSFFEKIKNYEVIIVDNPEHFWVDNWIELLKLLNDNNKIVIVDTFSIGLKHYINQIIPNNKILFTPIQKILLDNLNVFDKNIIDENPDFSKKRKHLLKFFSYNRNPQRDYVFNFLINNNLIEGNNLSFHNYPFETLSDDLDLGSSNISYLDNEMVEFLKDIDFKKLNNLRIIPKSENFNIEEQIKQTKNNAEASNNSYFEIICEAQMPISKDIANPRYYTYSISKRTLTPILFGNAFHIMPNSKAFEDELTMAGFITFFKNDNDFLNNLNEEFYFEKETQKIIKQNYEVLYKIYKNKQIKPISFIFEKLMEIYSIKP